MRECAAIVFGMRQFTVHAPCGELTGRVHGGPGSEDVFEIFNIPFASALPFRSARAIRAGQHSGIHREEPKNPLVITATAPFDSADCLNQPHPTLIWVHGGRYEIGHPSEPWSSTEHFSQAGITAFSIGYRKNLDGFWQDSESDHIRALDDLILALEWIFENGPAFGADLTNVTIAGQSAGAALVLLLAADDRVANRIHRAVAMSPAFSRLANSSWRRIAAGIGLGKKPTLTNMIASDERHRARAQRYVSLLAPSDPALGPRIDRFTPAVPTFVSATSTEFFGEKPVEILDRLPMREWMARGYARGHGGTGAYPTEAYAARPMGNVISDSAIRSNAVKIAERTLASGLDVWAAEFRPGPGYGTGVDGLPTTQAPHCVDIPRFFGGEEGHPFHSAMVEFITSGTMSLPKFVDSKDATSNRCTTIWSGGGALTETTEENDTWAPVRGLFGA